LTKIKRKEKEGKILHIEVILKVMKVGKKNGGKRKCHSFIPFMKGREEGSPKIKISGERKKTKKRKRGSRKQGSVVVQVSEKMCMKYT